MKIISPQNNNSFDKDASVTYKISVSDKEDGESKFDEINTKEVLLEVRYLKNGKAAPTNSQNNGVNIIMTSNCITCHGFNTKAMGPSFADINKRYPATKANVDSLTKRIQFGSTGIWGKEKMPPHQELSANDIKSIVQWITKSAADPNVNYYAGTDGYFRLKPDAQKGAYQLTASYTDHGLKDAPGKKLRGQDAVTISIK
ncbi:MAG: c-type cytochrome [Bacteroidetes bacterium]|nr:c-type cytochrome [Bacteroidota bacterium]